MEGSQNARQSNYRQYIQQITYRIRHSKRRYACRYSKTYNLVENKEGRGSGTEQETIHSIQHSTLQKPGRNRSRHKWNPTGRTRAIYVNKVQ
jgi:hypothetical protein